MNRNAKKQDVIDKVKEIKMRQKNWMKQRAESQDFKETTSPNKEAGGPSKAAPQQYTSIAKQESAPSSSINNLLSSHKSKAKFQNWLKAKEPQQGPESSITNLDHNVLTSLDQHAPYEGKVYSSQNYSGNVYPDVSYRDHKGTGDVNVLRVPSTRPAGYASPDPDWNSDDETGEITAAELLSAQDFDSRADNIIARVKGDLGLKGKQSQHLSSIAEKKPIGHQTYSDEKHKSGAKSDSLSSHSCPTCEKLMLPPSHSPMLLIPCGHTLCGQCCCVVKFCGLCGAAVQSTTANIMLEQIITKYRAKQAQHSHKTVAKSVDRDRYREEFQNLQTRQEVLHEESNSVKRSIQSLTKKLSREHEQVETILEEERNIQTQIKGLQEKLRVLVEHRGEYEETCEKLHTQTQQEKGKLGLIKDSMRGEYEETCERLHTQTQQEKGKLGLIKDSMKSIDEQMQKVRLFVEEGL